MVPDTGPVCEADAAGFIRELRRMYNSTVVVNNVSILFGRDSYEGDVTPSWRKWMKRTVKYLLSDVITVAINTIDASKET